MTALTPHEARARHRALHENLDRLSAHWIKITRCRPSQVVMAEFFAWGKPRFAAIELRALTELLACYRAATDDEPGTLTLLDFMLWSGLQTRAPACSAKGVEHELHLPLGLRTTTRNTPGESAP